jgi:superfamily II DNA/RNA helicase
MSFADLGLSEKVLQAVTAAGYSQPTPIQEQAIPHVLARRDVLGIAQTGTGKTAAFTLPMLTLLETGRARARMPRTLILEPTRELAAQVEENFDRYGLNHKLSVALLIGGVSFGDQDVKITRGADVLIATPGRLLDHIERGKLLLTGVELLVIDEADRMLDMGFIPDIERIVKLVPFTRQTLFFSATMPPEIQKLADAFLHNPVKIEVARPSSSAATITQRLVSTGAEDHDKRECLRELIRNTPDFKNAIIFCNRKREVATLYRSLIKHGFNAAALHGDLDQRARMAALDSFRNGQVTLLVASDVAARGLDIPAVSHVFNYDVPHHAEDYVHRIGRTGRAGRTGYAYTLVAPGDEKSLHAIEALTLQPVEWEGASVAERGLEAPRRRGRGEDRAPRGDAGERGERGGRTRAGRAVPRAGGRSRREAAPEMELAAEEPRAEAPARPAPRPRPEPRRAEATPRSDDHRRGAPPRGPDRPRSSGRYDPDERPVLGLGDHVPAFLLRPVQAKPSE